MTDERQLRDFAAEVRPRITGCEQALLGRCAKQPLGRGVEVFLGSHVPNASRVVRDPLHAIENLKNATRYRLRLDASRAGAGCHSWQHKLGSPSANPWGLAIQYRGLWHPGPPKKAAGAASCVGPDFT